MVAEANERIGQTQELILAMEQQQQQQRQLAQQQSEAASVSARATQDAGTSPLGRVKDEAEQQQARASAAASAAAAREQQELRQELQVRKRVLLGRGARAALPSVRGADPRRTRHWHPLLRGWAQELRTASERHAAEMQRAEEQAEAAQAEAAAQIEFLSQTEKKLVLSAQAAAAEAKGAVSRRCFGSLCHWVTVSLGHCVIACLGRCVARRVHHIPGGGGAREARARRRDGGGVQAADGQAARCRAGGEHPGTGAGKPAAAALVIANLSFGWRRRGGVWVAPRQGGAASRSHRLSEGVGLLCGVALGAGRCGGEGGDGEGAGGGGGDRWARGGRGGGAVRGAAGVERGAAATGGAGEGARAPQGACVRACVRVVGVCGAAVSPSSAVGQACAGRPRGAMRPFLCSCGEMARARLILVVVVFAWHLPSSSSSSTSSSGAAVRAEAGGGGAAAVASFLAAVLTEIHL
jgi:hypothetical protein